MKRIRIVTLAVGGFAAAAAAQTITDGNSTFNMPATSTTGAAVRNMASGGTASVMTAGGSAADHLFQQWWWYRVNGVNPREFGFSNRSANVAAGNTLTLDYTEPEGFTARVVYRLTDGPDSPASCNVANELRITNTSASALSIAVYSYLDYDVAATPADTAALLAPGRIRITDGTGVYGEFLGVGPNAYQVAQFAMVRANLTDADIDNFANTGLPFASTDWTGGFQWNLNIPVGGSATIRSAFSINQTASVGGCSGDLDGDNDRDLNDLASLLSAYGINASGDLDGDGDTDLNDLSAFLSVYGVPC
jgi:hypothetical protein